MSIIRTVIDDNGVTIESEEYTILIARPLPEGQVGIRDFNDGAVYNKDGELLEEFKNAAAFIEAGELLKEFLVGRYGGYK